MLQILVELVGNRVAGAARAHAVRVAALYHEAVEHAVEDQPVVEALLRKVDEILHRDRRLVLEKLDLKRALIRLKNCNGVCHFLRSFILVIHACRRAARRKEDERRQQKNESLLHRVNPPSAVQCRLSPASSGVQYGTAHPSAKKSAAGCHAG